MSIKPNEDGTYTLYCCDGHYFTGTYYECQSVADRILFGDVTVLSVIKR